MSGALRIEGELWLTLETVAECYEVEVAWLRDVYGRGLLGPGRRVRSHVAIRARSLERVAAILRWHVHHGFDLSVVELLLEE